MRLILHHWAFSAYVVWMLVVVVVILWPKGHVSTIVKKWWHKRRVSVTTSKLNAAATSPSENAVEVLRMKSVTICSSPCPDGEEAKHWTDKLRGAAAEAGADSRR
jgi:hypothetical protein